MLQPHASKERGAMFYVRAFARRSLQLSLQLAAAAPLQFAAAVSILIQCCPLVGCFKITQYCFSNGLVSKPQHQPGIEASTPANSYGSYDSYGSYGHTAWHLGVVGELCPGAGRPCGPALKASWPSTGTCTRPCRPWRVEALRHSRRAAGAVLVQGPARSTAGAG